MPEYNRYLKMLGSPRILNAPNLAMSPVVPSKRRISDIEVSVSIVYGTIAFFFWGKRLMMFNDAVEVFDDVGYLFNRFKSHNWTVYVRGATNEDIGLMIKRVVFHLHPTFNNPTRVTESPPFEVSESGWGEFEIGIRIFFQNDICDKPLELIYKLKLFAANGGYASSKKPVVTECYDEIVFPDPSENSDSCVRPSWCTPASIAHWP